MQYCNSVIPWSKGFTLYASLYSAEPSVLNATRPKVISFNGRNSFAITCPMGVHLGVKGLLTLPRKMVSKMV